MIKKILISVLIPAVFILSGCGDEITPETKSVERPLVEGIKTELIAPVQTVEYHEVSGTVMAKNTSLVSAKIMGEVKDIKVKPSDTVRKGDILLIIDSPDINARVKAASEAVGEAANALKMAEKNRDLMIKTFQRFSSLYNEKAISEQEFDEIRTKKEIADLEYELSEKRLNRARASLREARAYRNYTIIRSPLNGTVAETKIDTGSMTAPGVPLLVIEDPAYRAEVAVDEKMIGRIHTGMTVDVSVDALNMHTQGHVAEIVRRIDPGTRSFTVKIDIQDDTGQLRGGLYARARFPLEESSGIFVGAGSVVKRGELRGVYTVSKDGVITLRLVKTGKERDGTVEILSGLQPGERIISAGADRAVDGGRVR